MDILQHKKNRCQKCKKRNKGKRVECILPLGITRCSLPCTYKSRKSEKAKRKHDLCYLPPYCILLLISILFKLICKKGVSNKKAGNKKMKNYYLTLLKIETKNKTTPKTFSLNC